jgi:hypothetical protein
MKRFSIAREKFIRSRLLISEVICEADGRAGGGCMKRQVSEGTRERCEWVKIHLRAEREVGRSKDLELTE